jgi:genome maintenance exonuclease 1
MIKYNPIYTYKKLDRQDGGGQGRVYVDDVGNKIPSVTTILSKTKDMTHLIAWKKRIGEDKAKQITEESAGLGTTMHAHLEAYVLGEQRPGGNNYGRLMAQRMADTVITEGLIDVDEVWGVESHLYYENLWAGTTDLVGMYMGRPAIMDFKTTIKPKKREWVEDYRLQLAAYAMAHNNIHGTNIDTTVVFMVSRECEFQKFVWTGHEFEESTVLWSQKVADYYERFVF